MFSKMKYAVALMGVSFILNEACAIELNTKIDATKQAIIDLKGSL